MVKTIFARFLYLLMIMVALVGCESISQLALDDDNTSTNTNYESLAINGEIIYPVQVVVEPDRDVVQRIQDGLTFEPVINPFVTEHILWFQRNQNYLTRVLTRATPYINHILNELERRDLPLELALLPIIESAFDPFAYSSSRASGLWQIIPPTADYLNLRINWWVDERRDILQSTDAALNYLEELYLRLNEDWLLAAAGYNAGGTTIENALKRDASYETFWDIRPIIPAQTQNYVPRLIALSILFRYPELFSVDLPIIEDRPRFYELEVEEQIDMAMLANALGVDIEEVYLLNPGLNRWATEPDVTYGLLLPIEQRGLVENLLEDDPLSAVNWIRYEVVSGDTLGALANRFNTTVDAIMAANQKTNTLLRINEELLIPTPTSSIYAYSLSSDSRRLAEMSGFQSQQHQLHHVSSGDTLWSISNQYGVTIEQLASWNAINQNDSLTIGQEIIIISDFAYPRTTGMNASRRVTYTVREGDSLYVIASRFNLDVEDIVRGNNLNPNNYLQPGQVLSLQVDIIE